VRTAPVAATTATQRTTARLSLDLGVSGPRRSHIAPRIAAGGLGGRVNEGLAVFGGKGDVGEVGAPSPAWTASEPMPAALIPPRV
jgi:hypothetical protein